MGSVVPMEAAIVRRILKRLEAESPMIWCMKTHGSGMGRRGIPDIIGVFNGMMFALEVKRPGGGVVAPLQRWELSKIAAARGVAAVVESVEDAEEVLGLVNREAAGDGSPDGPESVDQV